MFAAQNAIGSPMVNHTGVVLVVTPGIPSVQAAGARLVARFGKIPNVLNRQEDV